MRPGTHVARETQLALSVFNVALVGRDEKGKFQAVYRVVASSEDEAVVMARASASLQDVAVFDIGGVATAGPPPEDNDEVRRVLGRGERLYAGA